MKNQAYQFKSFLPYKHIVHGISSKAFGSMKKEDGKLDYAHLGAFRKSLSIVEEAVYMQQIHGGNVSLVENTNNLSILDTDGLVTNKKYIPLAVLTADCLPILFYDLKKEVIGVVHAGYKGLLNHVIEHTIQKAVSTLRSNPKDILVGVGPSIERDCYEVGAELVEKFQEEFSNFDDIFVEKNQKFFLDLRGIALQCLLKEGILKEHIEVINICTKHDPNFYSYRGGDGNNRFTSILNLVE